MWVLIFAGLIVYGMNHMLTRTGPVTRIGFEIFLFVIFILSLMAAWMMHVFEIIYFFSMAIIYVPWMILKSIFTAMF